MVCSEHVPPEAAVTPLVTRLPLAEGAGVWAGALLSKEMIDRSGEVCQLQAAGFDIDDVAAFVKNKYLR